MLAVLIGGWAAITWGGRIGLLAGDETFTAKARIAVSLLVATVAVAGLLGRAPWRRSAVVVYALVTMAVWGSSAVSVLGDGASSVGFKLVHLALAAVSLFLAALAWLTVVRQSGPEQARQSEARSPAGQ